MTTSTDAYKAPSMPAAAHVNVPLHKIQDTQPAAPRPMDAQRPPTDEESDLSLRGGRGDMCPGRFCFCIPCPIPCDFCII